MMLDADYEPIAELRIVLTTQRYSPVVIRNYCAYVRGFVDYLAQRDLPIMDVTEEQVAQYLQYAIAMFHKRHGRVPARDWHSIPRSGIHALLRLAQGQWPAAPKATCAADALRFAICDEYETWLRTEPAECLVLTEDGAAGPNERKEGQPQGWQYPAQGMDAGWPRRPARFTTARPDRARSRLRYSN